MKLKLNIFDNVFKLNVNKNCCEANDKQKILMLNLVGWVCCEICPSTIFNMSAPSRVGTIWSDSKAVHQLTLVLTFKIRQQQ